jgi:deoxyribodipyrimidine photo-lyase
MIKQVISIHWFRRDLRLDDNAALYHSLKSGLPVLPLFILDTNILDKLENKADKRILFIHQALENLQQQLKKLGSSLLVKHGTPQDIWTELFGEFDIKHVFTNHDYEPYAAERDIAIAELLSKNGSTFSTYKDQCVFEKNEVTKDDDKPYTIFTPYKNKWLTKLNEFYLKPYPNHKYFKHFFQTKPFSIPTVKEISFEEIAIDFPPIIVDETLVKHYAETRDYPAINGTSKLSVHLRFGTISIRKLAVIAQKYSAVWLSELIWRDFYMMILWHFPHAAKSSFKPAYDKIIWRNNEQEFKAWCNGQTGYAIVDAGMRELNETGFMHNRVRMITANFLIKHLLIDWRWGEAYFAKKLLDFDLSANNGSWQWAASSGCDAAPYFRIFNPYEQTKKFDAKLQYIRKWVPEFEGFDYPQPIVDHKFARERVLATYKKALGA